MKWKLFDPGASDPVRFRALLRRPAPELTYVMFFTPRSGSSWWHDVVQRTGQLGKPGESFNPNFVPGIAGAIKVASLDDYVAGVRRRFAVAGVFGFQITHHQINATFDGPDTFLRHFNGEPSFWLIRRDIVAQAVSLHRKRQTNIAHRPHTDTAALRDSESRFHYDGPEIARWVKHIWAAERATDALVERSDFVPLRLCYEDLMPLGELGAANLVARHLGRVQLARITSPTPFEKIGTSRNVAFADRFRHEHASMMEEIDAERAARLAALVTDLAGYSPIP